MQIAAFCNGAVLTLTAPSADNIDPFALPWAAIKDFSSKKNHYVDRIVNGKTVTRSWTESSIPQTKNMSSPGLTDKRLPPLPDKTVTHSFNLFDAMVEAAKDADNQRIRYALDTICFRGANNQILSMDGKQALIQDDFDFPFDNDVLCPITEHRCVEGTP